MRVTETQSEIHGSIRALADRNNAQQSGDTKGLQRRQALWLRRRNPVDARCCCRNRAPRPQVRGGA